MQSLTVNSESASSGHIWLSSALGPPGRSNIAVHAQGRFLFASFRRQPVTKSVYEFAFDGQNETTPNHLIAIDHLGILFKFDLTRNKYRRLFAVGCAPTALSWQLAGGNGASDCAVATADGCIRGITTSNRSSQKMLSVERGHDPLLPANWLSANTSGTVLVSSSLDAAILWDTSAVVWHRIRRLVMRQQIDLAGALFVPMSDLLVTAFSDASVLVWQPDSLHLAFRLPSVPKSVTEGKESSPTSTVARHFTASMDGRWLASADADGCRLIIWSLDAKSPKLRGPRILNLLTWLPTGSSPGSVQSLTAIEQPVIKGVDSPSSFMVALVDHSLIVGVDVEQARPAFVSKPLLPLDIPDCHSISSVALMFSRSGQETVIKMAVLSAHSGCMFLVNEPDQLDVHAAKSHNPVVGNVQKGISKTKSEQQQRSLALSKYQERAVADACGIERSALVQMLRHYGAFPNRLRSLIWRLLLKLPRNHGAFASLLDRGSHPCVSGLATRYPVRSAKLLRLLARILSALAHWSPIFGETEFLPMFIFPFLHVFEGDPMACFELVATLLIGFCQHWFEYAPHPPIAVLSAIENLLAHADQRLLLHLTAHQLTAQDYAWPLLQTAFSEVLSGSDWLRVWDHVFAKGPDFFVAFSVAYLISSRSALMRLSDRDEFMFFIRNRNAVDIERVIAETHSLLSNAPSDVHPANAARLITEFDSFVLPVGPAYPVFDRYPKYVINFRSEERDRLRRHFSDTKNGDPGDSSRLFQNLEEDEERRQRFVAMERLHDREDVSLSGALGNEVLKPLYRGAKLESGLATALEQIEAALERLDSNEDEERGRALLRNAAEQLLDAVGETSEKEVRHESMLAKKMAALSPNRIGQASQAREQLRACVSELRRDLHRRRLTAEQPF